VRAFILETLAWIADERALDAARNSVSRAATCPRPMCCPPKPPALRMHRN
jgi:hypothetical protein